VGKKIEFNTEVFKSGDLVFTSSSNPVAAAIRFFTWGPWAAFDSNFPNHVGMIVVVEGTPLIVEMLATGIAISSLKEYNESSFFNERIVAVRRLSTLSVTQIDQLEKEAMFLKGKQVDYDFKGLLEFLRLGKNSPARFYCSEMCAYLYDMIGALKKSGRKNWSPKDLLMFACSTRDWVAVEGYEKQL
jgi:hypothetical protein